MVMTTDLGRVMETIAAISMHMGERTEAMGRVYEIAWDHIDGYTGLYRAAVDAAVALEAYGRDHKIFWGQDADWILTTEALGDALLTFVEKRKRIPFPEEREELVRASLTKS
jgi:hypothetical protein